MIGIGLGTFTELKAHLMNPSIIANTDYDNRITELGKFMTGRFEKYCNRKFDYTVGDTYECTANRAYVILPRYPLNGTPTIEISTGTTPAWQSVTGLIQSQSDQAGLVEFLAYQGPFYTRLRLTYTGGYWFPDTTLPSGAASRPDDLYYAWLLQCEQVWKERDVLGLNLANTVEQKATKTMADLKFVPEVQAIIDSYVRINMNG